jgi:F-type H+-transporting ATPase subunit gamma
MSQLKIIKDRITSAKETCKITQAMKMVSAAKFKSSSDTELKSRQYMDKLSDVLQMLVSQTDAQHSPLLSHFPSAKRVCAIVVSGDRGLCGGFNTNLIKHVNRFIDKQTKPVDFYFWGQKAHDFFKKSDITICGYETGLTNKTDISFVSELLEPIINDYISGKYSSIEIIYTSFKSIVASVPAVKTILPFSMDDSNTSNLNVDYFIDPSPEVVMESVITKYINLTAFRCIVESFSAEQGARMSAMDSATDNAKEVLSDLKLQYNRGRQAVITTELSEIVAGSEALKH